MASSQDRVAGTASTFSSTISRRKLLSCVPPVPTSATTSSRDRGASGSGCGARSETSWTCSSRPHGTTLNSLAVFLHHVGALGLFAALGLEWASVRKLRSAVSTSQACEWMKLLDGLRLIEAPALLVLL